MKAIMQQLQLLQQKKLAAMERIAAAARPIVPALQDHHLENTARELSVALFELDALQEEMQKLVSADPAAFMDAMLEALKGRGGAQ